MTHIKPISKSKFVQKLYPNDALFWHSELPKIENIQSKRIANVYSTSILGI